MTTEALQKRYPKLFDRLEDRDILLRNLVVVDENEKDVTDDDIVDEIYDPEVYTHVAYLYPEVVKIAGEKLAEIPSKLLSRDDIEECFDYEGDLWGFVTPLDAETIALLILDTIEAHLD